MFKDGIKPEWEDDANKEGGKWQVIFKKEARDNVNESWNNLLLAMIGNTFDDPEEINGCVVNPKKSQVKMAIWTKNKKFDRYNDSVGRNFVKFIETDQEPEYAEHNAPRGGKGGRRGGVGGSFLLMSPFPSHDGQFIVLCWLCYAKMAWFWLVVCVGGWQGGGR